MLFFQLEHYIKGGTSPTSVGYTSGFGAGDQSVDGNVVQQVAYLKNKLEEEHTNYKRKLQAYQDGQQRQAQLIQKLQQKVLQYKRKCGELENSVNESKSSEEDAKKKVWYYRREFCFRGSLNLFKRGLLPHYHTAFSGY